MIFFNKPMWRPVVLLVLMLGTIGYIAAGVIVTSMTIQTRSREVLLPVLLLPSGFAFGFTSLNGGGSLYVSATTGLELKCRVPSLSSSFMISSCSRPVS